MWNSGSRSARLAGLTTVLAVGVGIVLRAIQYGGDRSLWLNEAMLADNIVQRSLGRLFAPLAMVQVAPYGFLAVERTIVDLFGTSEWALRAFPFACGVLALIVFALMAHRVCPPWTAAIAVLLFAFCWPLIYQSSEVKQYSTDVAVSVVLLWCGARAVLDGPWRGRAAAGVALLGAAGVWLSYPALFTAAGVGLVMIGVSRGTDRRTAVGIAAAWAIAALPVVIHSRSALTPADARWMQGYWNEGFLPLVPHSRRELLWLPHAIFDLYRTAFGIGFPWLVAPLAVLGAGWLWMRNRVLTLVFLLPVAFALAASALHLYPFLSRVSLFLAPTAFLVVAGGLTLLWTRVPYAGPVLAGAAAALIVGPMLRVPPEIGRDGEALRGVTAYVATHHGANDPIYVYMMAAPGFMYYADRFGIPSTSIRYGGIADHGWGQYQRELAPYRGAPRLWVVASHLNSQFGVFGATLISEYLEANGCIRDSVATTGAWGRLYDLRDTACAGPAAATFTPRADAFVNGVDPGR